MQPGRALMVALLLFGLGTAPAHAGAWTKKKGQGQAFLKWEAMRAREAYDAAGMAQDLPGERQETTWSVVTEYGLSDTLTVQLKGDWQDGQDAGFAYRGRGPIELGLNWQVWRDDRTAVSVYGAVAEGGDARNAGYSLPGQGGRDIELRFLAGRSTHFVEPRLGVDSLFAEVQVARRLRQALADETRFDLTLGANFGSSWLWLGQAFGGVSDDSGPQWLLLESSAVRHFGQWSVQAGWRQAVRGRESPVHEGVVLALWRRF